MQTLAGDLLLLALDDRKGHILKSAHRDVLPYSCAGAVIMDLVILERLRLVEGEVSVCDPKPIGEPILDRPLEFLGSDVEKQSLASAIRWVARIGGDLERLILDRLVEQGFLALGTRRVLWIFPVRCYRSADDRREANVKARLRQIAENKSPWEERDAVLVSLARTCNLQYELFPRSDLRQFAEGQAAGHEQAVTIAKAVLDTVANAHAKGLGGIAVALNRGSFPTTGGR